MDGRLKVFIDTNVFLDYVLKRPIGFMEAVTIFNLAATDRIVLCLADLTIANAKYCTRKDISISEFYSVIKGFRELFAIVPIGAAAVDQALAIEPRDFEDALQYFSAAQAGADCIVSRNIKDFGFSSSVEVLSPQDFLYTYFPNETFAE